MHVNNSVALTQKYKSAFKGLIKWLGPFYLLGLFISQLYCFEKQLEGHLSNFLRTSFVTLKELFLVVFIIIINMKKGPFTV